MVTYLKSYEKKCFAEMAGTFSSRSLKLYWAPNIRSLLVFLSMGLRPMKIAANIGAEITSRLVTWLIFSFSAGEPN